MHRAGSRSVRLAAPIAAVLLCSPVIHGASQTLTVLQWNVFHGGRGTDDRAVPARQVNWMAAKHPDVVSLNEVTAEQAEVYRQRLEDATGETWYSHHVRAQDDGIGNQILSRHPFLGTDSYHMRTNGQYRRAVAEASIEVGGTVVHVFSAHLDNSSSEVRRAQATELLGFMSGFNGARLLAGDLNARPESPEIQLLTSRLADAWTAAVQQARATAYPDNPPGPDTRTRVGRIDYILYSRGLTAVQADIPDLRDLSADAPAVQMGTLDDAGVRPSDHNLVFAVFGTRSSNDAASRR